MDELYASGITFWHWWVLGFALLVVEMLAPGFFCMWIGLAALATGLVVWVFPALSLPIAVVLFALLSLAFVALWFRLRRLRTTDTLDSGLNQRGRSYIGRVLTLSKDISDGIGQARLDDTVWRVSGPSLPAGAQVRVTGCEGSTLRVEASPESHDQR